MSIDTEREITALTGEVKLLLFGHKEDEAIVVLNNIITRLSKSDQQDIKMKNMLTLSYTKRINLSFKKGRYEDIVADVHCIKHMNYDIYNDKDMLLIYHESRTAIHNSNTLEDLKKFKQYDDIEYIKENIDINSAKRLFEGKNNKQKV